MNSIEKKIEKIFPPDKEIPKEFSLKLPIKQKEYLINGQLVNWQGKLQEIHSPICRRTTEGGYASRSIGFTPKLNEKESLKALDGAYKAYNHGMGKWPTMSVEKKGLPIFGILPLP